MSIISQRFNLKPRAFPSRACRHALAVLGLSLLPMAQPVWADPLQLGSEISLTALALVDLPYRFGGNSPETGFDCSGLVHYVIGNILGESLPRQSADMSRVGLPVQAVELQPGDLVFFNTLNQAFSHVGIYVGAGSFIHASSSATGKVMRSRLDDAYWARRFDGARRLPALVAPPALPVSPLPEP